jgi:hypothetical protein
MNKVIVALVSVLSALVLFILIMFGVSNGESIQEEHDVKCAHIYYVNHSDTTSKLFPECNSIFNAINGK